jgi:hypothetical protein
MREALTRAWPALVADERAGLRTVLRLALQRYVANGVGDTMVIEPLVALAYCGEDDLGQDDRYDYNGTGSQIRELVTACCVAWSWLAPGPTPRGSASGTGSSLAIRSRMTILRSGPWRSGSSPGARTTPTTLPAKPT